MRKTKTCQVAVDGYNAGPCRWWRGIWVRVFGWRGIGYASDLTVVRLAIAVPGYIEGEADAVEIHREKYGRAPGEREAAGRVRVSIERSS